MQFEELTEYTKDVQRLSRKYRTLKDDLNTVKKVVQISPAARPPFSFRIDGLGIEDCVIKVKKIASKSFKGKGVNSGFRLVYAYFEEQQKVIFIELYHKSKKASEDRARIKTHFK